jgi:alpha-ketoglutarate-dependent taurine dioxygenase
MKALVKCHNCKRIRQLTIFCLFADNAALFSHFDEIFEPQYFKQSMLKCEKMRIYQLKRLKCRY